MSLTDSLGGRTRTGRFKTGLAYTRRSLGFQARHPVALGLALVQVVVVVGALVGLGALAIHHGHGSHVIDPVFLAGVVGVYLVVSVCTTLTNAVLTGYVFGVEMGSSAPLENALLQVRRRLGVLLGYALLAATVLSLIRVGIGWLRGRMLVGEIVATLLEITAIGAWYAATIYAVPVIVFEEERSLRDSISKSASLLGESKWSYLSAVTAWPVVLGFLVLGVAALFAVGGLAGLLGAVGAIVLGIVVYRAFNAIFKAYLYGEVAGPFEMGRA